MKRSGMAIGLLLAGVIGCLTPARADDEKKVLRIRLTGCLATGERDTFVLNKAVPFMSAREERMAGGMDPMTPTMPDAAKPKTYDLVPGKGVKLADHVGHRVDVTGTIETSDPHAGHGAASHGEAGSAEKDAKSRVTVISIQHLAPTCS